MSKLFKIITLAMLVVAVTASGALAAGTITATSKVIDYKLMTGDSYRVGASTMNAITYTTGTILTQATNTFNLVLTGASWGQSTAINMSGRTTSGGAYIANVATCTPVVGEKTCLMTLQAAALVAGGVIGPGMDLTIFTAGNAPFDLLVPASFATAMSSTATIAVSDVLGTGAATAAATTLLTVDSTKTLKLTGAQIANSGVVSTVGGRTVFTTAVAGSTRNVGTLLTWSDNANIAPNVNLAGFKVSLAITGNFSGISAIGWGTGGSTSACSGTSCTVTLTNQLGTNMGAASNLIFTSDNSTALTPRTWTISSATVTAVGEKTDPITFTTDLAGTTITLTSDGFNAVVPGLVYDATGAYYTSCTINNPAATATIVDMDLLNAYTGVTGTGYYQNIVTVPAKGSARVTIGEPVSGVAYNGVRAYLWSGGQSGNAVLNTATSIGTLGDYDRFQLKFTLTGSLMTGANTISCTQRDAATGAARTLTVLTPDPNTVDPWRN